MPDLKLYHYPVRACSHVTFNALEEAGIDYDDQSIDIFKGEQKSPEYLKIHPGGKVPALVVDGKTLTENAAILMYLSSLAPDAGLLPKSSSDFERSKYYSDLVWVSSTFHPAIRQVRMAIRFTDGDPAGVQSKGIEFSTAIFDMLKHAWRATNGGMATHGRWLMCTSIGVLSPRPARSSCLWRNIRLSCRIWVVSKPGQAFKRRWRGKLPQKSGTGAYFQTNKSRWSTLCSVR